MKMRIAIVSSVLLAAACGREPEPQQMELTVPIHAALQCDNRAELANMEAFVRIGGHANCDLDIDATTLEASGSCDRITIGIVRPLMIVYEYPGPTGSQDAQLAYHVGWVDLDKERLEPGQTTVSVQLGNVDDGTGALIIGQAALENWVATGGDSQLDSAVAWAFEQANQAGDTLDHDADDCENIVELCDRGAAGFFSAGNPTDACP